MEGTESEGWGFPQTPQRGEPIIFMARSTRSAQRAPISKQEIRLPSSAEGKHPSHSIRLGCCPKGCFAFRAAWTMLPPGACGKCLQESLPSLVRRREKARWAAKCCCGAGRPGGREEDSPVTAEKMRGRPGSAGCSWRRRCCPSARLAGCGSRWRSGRRCPLAGPAGGTA